MRKKVVLLLATFTLLLGLVTGAMAAPILESISAHLNWSVKFKIDGQDWTPYDPSGNKLAPITYKGSNYLPVRAIGEALGVAVDWDGDTQTIFLGEKSDTVAITAEKMNLRSNAISTTDKQYTVQDGIDYNSGIFFEKVDSIKRSIYFTPNNKYQKLQLIFFSLVGEYDIDIKVIGANDNVLKHEVIPAGTSMTTIDVDIGGQKEIEFDIRSHINASESLFFTGYYK